MKLPKDATSIISTNKIKFIAQEIFRYSLYILPAINQLQDHVLQISKWQQLLITNFQESGDINLLIVFIQSNKTIIITSDGSKSRKVSKGTWTIADETGGEIFTGNNLYFVEINQISSHWAEIYGVLLVLPFLNEYSEYFSTQITSKVLYYCDNQEVILKLTQISDNTEVY